MRFREGILIVALPEMKKVGKNNNKDQNYKKQ